MIGDSWPGVASLKCFVAGWTLALFPLGGFRDMLWWRRRNFALAFGHVQNRLLAFLGRGNRRFRLRDYHR